MRAASRTLTRLLSIAVCVGAWHLAASHDLHLGFVAFASVPTPMEVAEAAVRLVQSPKFLLHLTNSLWRVAVGFVAAAAVGIGAGLWIGRSRWAEDVLLPPLEVLRPIPGVAWIPLSILMFPSSELSMIFITFIGAVFPILLNTIHGVEAVDPIYVTTSRSLGAGRIALLREVILPGALPSVVTGLSIGMGTSWFCLVTAEMIGGQYGLGYYTWESYNLQRYPDIVVGMVLIGVFGMGSSVAIRRLGTRLMPWVTAERKSA